VKQNMKIILGVFATLGTFVFTAVYFKALFGGSWRIPLVIATVITVGGLVVLLCTKERKSHMVCDDTTRER
jgi:hypothetical protein